jgi:ABC-2 type transport system permease protein
MNTTALLDTTAPAPSSPATAPTRLPSPDATIPMQRLIRVEIRKSMNTRAGKWLLAAIVGGTAIVMGIMVIVGIVQDQEFGITDFTRVANFFPMALLLPVLGVLSVTGEWAQRTNMVTFTLEPRRSRVVGAKLTTGVIMSLAATVSALLIGVVALGVFDIAGGAAIWSFSAQAVVAFGLLQLIGVLTGFAFGMLILNTPAAIVAFFAYTFILPTIFLAGASLWDWVESIRPWLDFNFVQEPLVEGSLTAVNWGQFTVATLLWFVTPVAFGVRRLLRAEIK